MATREAKIIAIIEDENGVEISSSIDVEFEDQEGESFPIDFEYTKAPAEGGPILMPKPPRM